MKMRYQHLKITKKIKKFLVPTLPFFFAMTLVLSKVSFPVFISNVVYTIAYPVWTIRDAFLSNVTVTSDFFSTKETVLKENRTLREELSMLRRKTFLTEVYKNENKRLQKLLDRTHKQEGLISASVIHGESFSPYDTFIIDIGAEAGVRNDMLILSPEGIAIGAITNTLQKTALVTQFSAPTMTVHAVISATSSFQTMLTGYGGGTLRVSIPRDVEIVLEDNVTLPSFETYLIGNIASIEVEPEDAYKTLYIRSPVNMYELRYVLVDTATVWKNTEQIGQPVPETTPEEQES